MLVAAFMLCFCVLFFPTLGWYSLFVFGSPYDAKWTISKIIAAALSTKSESFSILSLFMAPIAVLIGTRISAWENSPLVYISAPFLVAVLLAVIAPLTITDRDIKDIGNLLEGSNLDGTAWALQAQGSFIRYAESFASTSAVLLGIQLRAQ
jgi:hypothetical protein